MNLLGLIGNRRTLGAPQVDPKPARELASTLQPERALKGHNGRDSFDCWRPRARVDLQGGSATPTTLRTERLDTERNCLQRAAEQAQPGDTVLFLKDGKNADGNDAGHVVLQRGEQIVDPTSGESYADLQQFQARNPQYTEVQGRCTGSQLQDILSAKTPEAREAAIARAGLSEIASQRFADDGPPVQELIDRAKQLGSKYCVGFTEDQLKAINDLDSTKRKLFAATLDQLEALDRGEINSAQYMTNVMQKAADLAGCDGKRFVDLVHFAFNQSVGEDYKQETARDLLGAGYDPAGSRLEALHDRIVHGHANEGFNPAVTDTNAPGESTVTHHFAEFLAVGAHSPNRLGQEAQKYIDDPKDNPGDVRSGYFAIMLGDALEGGKISPQEAVNLVKFAYQKPQSCQKAPWPPDSEVAQRDRYDIDAWKKAMKGG